MMHMPDKKFYEKSVTIGTETVAARTYRCPTHHIVLFRVPADLPIPKETIEFDCPQGDKVVVPKFDDSQKI
jgi:hypothetical protein